MYIYRIGRLGRALGISPFGWASHPRCARALLHRRSAARFASTSVRFLLVRAASRLALTLCMLRARYARAARATRVEGLKNSQKQSKSVKISQKQAVTHSKFENFENLTPFSGLFCHSKMVFMSKVVGNRCCLRGAPKAAILLQTSLNMLPVTCFDV